MAMRPVPFALARPERSATNNSASGGPGFYSPAATNPRQYSQPVGGPSYSTRPAYPMHAAGMQINNFNHAAGLAEARNIRGAFEESNQQLNSRNDYSRNLSYEQGMRPAYGGRTSNEIMGEANRMYSPAIGYPGRNNVQPVDGRYAVNPQGRYAMGGQYALPGQMMPRPQAPTHDPGPGLKANPKFSSPGWVDPRFTPTAVERRAVARGRLAGAPTAGLSTKEINLGVDRQRDLTAMRRRGINTSDPRTMRSMGVAGAPVSARTAYSRGMPQGGEADLDVNTLGTRLMDQGVPGPEAMDILTTRFGSDVVNQWLAKQKSQRRGFLGLMPAITYAEEARRQQAGRTADYYQPPPMQGPAPAPSHVNPAMPMRPADYAPPQYQQNPQGWPYTPVPPRVRPMQRPPDY